MPIRGQVAIVVGGANGIGKSVSQRLAREGAKVVIADMDVISGKALAEDLTASGSAAEAVKLDMTDETHVNEVVRDILNRFGQIEILVNVAGGSKGRYIRDDFGPFAESTKEMWDRILDINLNGARNCTRAVINHMIEKKRGKIVNMASLAGVQGAANAVDYSAAKAGIIGFTKALAKEVSNFGIQVNCISPGGVATDRMRAFIEAKQKQDVRSFNPETMAQPDEIASIVYLLVSDEARHIMGENIVVAGYAANADRK